MFMFNSGESITFVIQIKLFSLIKNLLKKATQKKKVSHHRAHKKKSGFAENSFFFMIKMDKSWHIWYQIKADNAGNAVV